MAVRAVWAAVLLSVSALIAAAPRRVPGPGAPVSAGSSCGATQGLKFVCGAEHPEDLAHIPDTRWLISSGFSDGAGLKLIDMRADTLSRWYTGAASQIAPDPALFPQCPTPPDPRVFNAHGISLRTAGAGIHHLYVVNHGGRESVEVFTVDSRGDEPKLFWKGCVLMPQGLAANSVASFPDGTILASVLTRPGTAIADFVRGRKTGAIYQWKRGSMRFEMIPGTQLPGNNGLETSADGAEFYVVAFGWHAVVVFSRKHPQRGPLRTAVAPGFMPDNIHWDAGRLLVAGMRLDEPACGGVRRIINGRADDMHCHRGYVVAQLDPQRMSFHALVSSGPNPDFNGVSSAVIARGEVWLGSYQADRIAHRALPAPGRPLESPDRCRIHPQAC